jgi:hypothetical protein
MQSQVPCNDDYHGHDADDVKNVHVHSDEGVRDFNLKTQPSKSKVGHVHQVGSEQNSSLCWPYFIHGECPPGPLDKPVM